MPMDDRGQVSSRGMVLPSESSKAALNTALKETEENNTFKFPLSLVKHPFLLKNKTTKPTAKKKNNK